MDRSDDSRSAPIEMTTWGLAVRWVTTFVSIVATGVVGFALPGWGAHFPLPILPSGIAVAVTYRWGRRMWLPVLLADAAIARYIGQPLFVVAGVALGFTGGAIVSVWLLDRNGFDANFSRALDAPIFLFAVVAGMTLAPTIGMVAVLLSGVSSEPPDIVRWFHWWSNTVIGVLLVSPALIAMSRQSLTRFTEHWVEGALWMLGVAILCGVMALTPGPSGRSTVVMFAILIVAVVAIRFGLVISALGAIAISFTTAYSIAFGAGIFGNVNELSGRLIYFLFSATLIAASLVITALLAERDAAALERLRAERRYAQIFNGSPQAIWVHDPLTLDFLLVNEAAQRQYGWTLGEFLSMTVSSVAPPGEPNILPTYEYNTGGSDDHAAPFETRHLTKDGRILEVEVWMRSIDLGGRAAELVFAVDVSERRSFGKALIDVLAGEQRRIAGEIHDGLGQELTGLALSLRALATRAQRNQPLGATDLDDLAKLATRCIEGSKKIVQGLSPLSDAGGSLELALDSLARRASLSGTPVRFQACAEAPLTVKTEALDHFYRIAQEAVQNALKHAAATAIDIELWTDSSEIRLSILDDGRGLPTSMTAHHGLGMRTMHFRARAIGGTLVIETPRGGGTAVRCEAPQGNAVTG
jgi:PAS domain S-box-containing protein